VWKSWYAFRRGKKQTGELDAFTYRLEAELSCLQADLEGGTYHHGGYRSFTVTDNKKRTILVAGIRDRVVHRLVYEYLVPIYDKTFSYDVWSCRKGKGLLGAILRIQGLSARHPRVVVWRADIRKFFDNIDHAILLRILSRKIDDANAMAILREIVSSHAAAGSVAPIGIPIGNLTSQIFANIYLHELDRFVAHALKPLAYVRYGDDFLVYAADAGCATRFRRSVGAFLHEALHLEINSKQDTFVRPWQGLNVLGMEIFPNGRRLNRRNRARIMKRLNFANSPGYHGILRYHGNEKARERFDWRVLGMLDEEHARADFI